MLKRYIYKGLEWQYEEGMQPKGAVEVAEPTNAEPEPTNAEPEPSKKAAQPANKSRKAVRTK